MAFFPQHHLQQPPPPNTYRSFVPADGQTTAPIAFFSTTSFPDQSHPSFVHVMGLAPGSVPAADGGSNGWEPRSKKLKEQDFLENSQISSIDFLQTGSVSTGLGLSLDDRRVAASSGDSPLPLLPMIDEDIDREVQRMDAEMDRFIKIEVERLRQSILEKMQAKQFQTLATVEDNILRKIREKESEVEEINKRNMELEDQMKQLAMEVGTWQHRAKYNENMIAHLKYSLDQVYAQSRDNKEGCGDSEVDDTASYCNGGVINLQLMCKENKEMKDSMVCKICKLNEACMLLLPCRHLCLCKECESKLSFCPLCQSSKFIGMEIYM
ncbi:probable BOI-related E3 ubiquitin-protein ligase 2 [Elaeis guineensis]|uniref:Probable BOI-related E3 ubiquitin-protein ligase 2 n=2 Tax=Elaeis guineensis var. tenera TaxID=51953 RepID=K0A252_ELAGV|nr:probable BOI-related E3 ubiquitin-protein ligase 2 [Elaeis guineensis]AFS65100.1 S-ribonuclease binding protein [Elaeis guineensis]